MKQRLEEMLAKREEVRSFVEFEFEIAMSLMDVGYDQTVKKHGKDATDLAVQVAASAATIDLMIEKQKALMKEK